MSPLAKLSFADTRTSINRRPTLGT